MTRIISVRHLVFYVTGPTNIWNAFPLTFLSSWYMDTSLSHTSATADQTATFRAFFITVFASQSVRSEVILFEAGMCKPS